MSRSLARRILPHPLMTILLVVVWCLLENVFSAGVAVFGLILGIVIPIMTASFWPGRPLLKHPLKMFEYIGIVVWDIIVANIEVARIVLFKPNAEMSRNWVCIPLELRTPEAIAILAGTITLTPGTVSADMSDGGHALLVHALDAKDPEAVAREIKARYETRLREIFE